MTVHSAADPFAIDGEATPHAPSNVNGTSNANVLVNANDPGPGAAGTGGGGSDPGSGSGSDSGSFTSTSTSTFTGSGGTPMDPEAIRSAIQARVRYPRNAERLGLEGTVLVQFHIDSHGAVSALRVLSPSNPALDAAALAAVAAAAPFASPPGNVRVPVEFSLPDL